MKAIVCATLGLSVLVANVISAIPASAAGNPCARQESLYNSSVRNLDRWATEIQRRTEELYRLNDRIQTRQFDLYQQFLDAQAYAQYINGVSNAESANCGLNFFFNRNFNCFIAAARNKANRQRSAEYRIQSAKARYDLYLVQAAGQQQRQAQRVVDAQNLANVANQQVATAAASVNACVSSAGVNSSPYYY